MSRSHAIFTLVAWAWLCVSSLAWAWAWASVSNASAQGSTSVDDRATSFQATTGAVKEEVAGGPLLVAAYGFVWLAVFGYVVRLGRLQAGAEARVAALERAVAAAKGDGARAAGAPQGG